MKIDHGTAHTNFYERKICVVSEESVGAKGYDCVNWWHIENPYSSEHDKSQLGAKKYVIQTSHLTLVFRIRVISEYT